MIKGHKTSTIFNFLFLITITLSAFFFWSTPLLAQDFSLPNPRVKIPGLETFKQPEIKFTEEECQGKRPPCLLIPWINEYVTAAYNFTVKAAGILVVAFIAWGGTLYITAGGNASQISKARNIITSAIIGLVLLLGSYIFLFLINPALVNWQGIIVPKISEKILKEDDNCPVDKLIIPTETDKSYEDLKATTTITGGGDCGKLYYLEGGELCWGRKCESGVCTKSLECESGIISGNIRWIKYERKISGITVNRYPTEIKLHFLCNIQKNEVTQIKSFEGDEEKKSYILEGSLRTLTHTYLCPCFGIGVPDCNDKTLSAKTSDAAGFWLSVEINDGNFGNEVYAVGRGCLEPINPNKEASKLLPYEFQGNLITYNDLKSGYICNLNIDTRYPVDYGK